MGSHRRRAHLKFTKSSLKVAKVKGRAEARGRSREGLTKYGRAEENASPSLYLACTQASVSGRIRNAVKVRVLIKISRSVQFKTRGLLRWY